MTIQERLATAKPPAPEELAKIQTFGDLSAEDLGWLASQMLEVHIPLGESVTRKGEKAEYMVVILEGEFRTELEDGRNYIGRAGLVTGILPYSRLEIYPANSRTTMPTRLAVMHKDHFPELLQRIPVLQPRLIGILSDRIRDTTRAMEQREKLTALGKLSAGLAHELNNPASAARRAAENLREALRSLRSSALKLNKGGLPEKARIFLAELECKWDVLAGPQQALDSLERSDREEELSSWLQKRNVEAAWDLAAPLVEVGCTIETMQEIEANVPDAFLNDVLIRITAAFTIGRLSEQIASATERISELVRAIKEYSYMDQAPEQSIDIHRGIENTLIMLHHKMKKGVEVVREYDRTLPKVVARGSELNQIWTNLIVNAIEAMQGNGRLTIRTLRDHNCARVEVIDNGPGIPDEIKSHIFEPFFTTKPVGEGSGLGLDVVQRIARTHRGDVIFESRPGETRFVVRIPLGDSSSSGPA